MLREVDADVVALQEANDRANAERLANELELELVYGEANTRFAVAWLSRLPVARSANHRLPELEKTLLEIEVRGCRLFTTHLAAGRDLAGEEARLREVEAILDVARDAHMLAGDFNAVAPDDRIGVPTEPLEHVSRLPVGRVLAAGFVDAYRELHEDDGWTYEVGALWARLDHIFVRGLCVERCEVVDAGASDHLPLVAELSA